MPKQAGEISAAERETYYHAHSWIIKHIVAVADDGLTDEGMDALTHVIRFFVEERIAVAVAAKDLPAALRTTV